MAGRKREKYAVWKDNKAVTEFEYDECGSLESGLLAAKKDGKWGYIDESGKTVIPFEYDVSWKHYASPYPDTDMGEYCYAATEGYVPLVKDGKWEMRNTENKIVIPSGTFEEILPVHNGRCWVKKDGKWGVIEFEKAVKDQRTIKITKIQRKRTLIRTRHLTAMQMRLSRRLPEPGLMKVMSGIILTRLRSMQMEALPVKVGGIKIQESMR